MTKLRRITLYFTLAGVLISAFSFLKIFTGQPNSQIFDYILWFFHAPIIYLSLRLDISYAYIQGPLGVVYFAALGFLFGTVLENSSRKRLHLLLLIAGVLVLHVVTAIIVAVEYEGLMRDIEELTAFVNIRGE